MKSEVINKDFKQTFKFFLKEKMGPCKGLIAEIESCETYNELWSSLKEYSDLISIKLGNECVECENKDDEIEELNDSVRELNGDLIYAEKDLKVSFTPRTMDDEYKLDAFKKSKDNFSVSDFESLLD